MKKIIFLFLFLLIILTLGCKTKEQIRQEGEEISEIPIQLKPLDKETKQDIGVTLNL